MKSIELTPAIHSPGCIGMMGAILIRVLSELKALSMPWTVTRKR